MWNFELGHSPRRKQLRDCEKDNGAFFTESSIIFYIYLLYPDYLYPDYSDFLYPDYSDSPI